MTDSFVHLHVASGYSLRHGASHPEALVARAAEHGMDALALTDRDGVYGAVKFAKACAAASIRPLFGVDLATLPTGQLSSLSSPVPSRERAPVRGGATVDLRHPRVTLLARDGRGWATLCRLISAAHLEGERGRPAISTERVAEAVAAGSLFLLLGPESEVGRAMAQRQYDFARTALRRWRDVAGPEAVRMEVVSWRGQGDSSQAARVLGLAGEEQVSAVLTNAVRYADRSDAPVADVLDAARRLVVLDPRHVDRVTSEGFLKTGKEMRRIAEDVTRAAGLGEGAALRLLSDTRKVADQCALDPVGDLGLGTVHFPELATLDTSGRSADAVLRDRCEGGFGRRGYAVGEIRAKVGPRLDAELEVITGLGYASYFLTVADVTDLIRERGVRVAARGSGAGSLVNYLLGISGVDPLRHGLLMERFLSPRRTALPDIDIDVESERRTEMYEAILKRFGADRTTCVSMMDTYRVRHAIRDVGAALGLPPGEIDTIAKAFPHLRARNARQALRELPELRASRIGEAKLDLLFALVERLDGLPRHIALHPCGVILSDRTLLDRTPVEASWLGFPMSQFDKDDVEDLGLLKLDVLGIRMQSAMAHATAEIQRVDGVPIDLDTLALDDPATYELIASTRTLGCFQIESPGQRELIGKFGPETFDDLIIDISLFRPGPVKSDMVTPFLQARHGWKPVLSIHEDLREILAGTSGVVVFHEQVMEILVRITSCSLAEADEMRRGLGDSRTQPEVEVWFRSAALGAGYALSTVDAVWDVLRSFGSFGFCKAHAAAFALPTYQSAWLKAHHPAAFLAGILTSDPGMYPKRLILDDARQFGIGVLPLDVNYSGAGYNFERLDGVSSIRLALADVKGISAGEVARILAGRPFVSFPDFLQRSSVSRPVVERLILVGAFDSLLSRGPDDAHLDAAASASSGGGAPGRRDLLLQLGEWEAQARSAKLRTGRSTKARRGTAAPRSIDPASPGQPGAGEEQLRDRPDSRAAAQRAVDVRLLAAQQSQAPRRPEPVEVQLPLFTDLLPVATSGLPEMTPAERVRAELEVLGLDVSCHVLHFYRPFLENLSITRSASLVGCRSKQQVLVAGVKVATQTPPIRSGKRVVFVTLDDSTGPIDATFFEDAQVGYASTLFHSWLLLIRGEVRRTGPRGVSLRATGCWELPAVYQHWRAGGKAGVEAFLAAPAVVTDAAIEGAAASQASRPVLVRPPVGVGATTGAPDWRSYDDGEGGSTAGGMGPGRAPRKLWHSSSGSSGA